MVATRQRGIGALQRLTEIARSVGDPISADEAAAVADRVAHDLLVVACVGQFKRGKSTLIDALLGDPVLPSGVTPVTAVPTLVRFGEQRIARIRDRNGEWREIPVDALAAYVSEELNPGNEKGVAAAEVLEPAPLLAHGMCLVDTPGLGSVFDSNTKATLALVPQIDAALVVIGTDPPLSGAELQLIADAARHVDQIIVVLNKADRVDAHERDEACVFAKRLIEGRLVRPVERIYQISAKDQLNGSGSWPDWDDLIAALERLAVHSGRALSHAAGARAIERLTVRLAEAIAAMERTLAAPLAESEERIARLQTIVEDGQHKLADLSAALSMQEGEVATRLGDRARSFLAASSLDAHRRLDEHLRTHMTHFGPRLRRLAMADAQEITYEAVIAWRSVAERDAKETYEQAMQRFANSASTLWESLRKSGIVELRSLPDIQAITAAYAEQSQFRFNEQIAVARPASPLRYAADTALVWLGLRGVIARDAHRFLDWLLELNVGRVESDLVARAHEGRRVLERRLRTLLASTHESAKALLERTRFLHEQGAVAVRAESDRLGRIRTELEELGSQR
jgi:GTP-binding protein EngB required for normal cell division